MQSTPPPTAGGQTLPGNPEAKPPPGPQGQRLRNLRLRMKDQTKFMNRLRREYGEIVSFGLPFLDCCVVFDAELIREVLVTQQPSFRPWFPADFDKERKYGGIALKQGEEQRLRGKFMAAVFAEESEGAYAEIVARQAGLMRDRLLARQSVDLVEEFDRFAWDAIVEIVLGRGVELPRQLCEETLSLAQAYMMLSILPGGQLIKPMPLPALRNGRKSRDLVDEALYDAIRLARRDGYSGADIATKYARAMDLEDSATVLDCDEAIVDELIALLVTQIDGPTSTLAFGVHYLARNPDIRARVEREVDTVLNARDIDGADFDRLPYTNALLNEVLRIDPPTAVMLPKEATEDRIVGGHLIRKGTLVHVAMRSLHHEPEYWDEPQAFRPERWLENPHPTCPAHAYMPFGLGPHFCQGMEVGRRLFVFGIASLAQNLRLAPLSAEPPPRNNAAVGVLSPWTVEVHARQRPHATSRGSAHDPIRSRFLVRRPDSPSDGGVRQVLLAKATQTIDADPETVFATLAHGGRHGEALPEVESVEFVSAETMGLGARFRENRKGGAVLVLFMKLAKLHRNVIECTEFEPCRRVRYVSHGAGTDWHSIYTLSPEGDGRTTAVELRLETRPRNLLGKRLPQGLKGALQKASESDLKAIRDHIENAAS